METRALLFYSGTMDWIKREEASRRLDSDCRIDTTCNGRHDFIRTPFWLFKYFLESLSNLLSTDLESSLYLFGVNRNPQFTKESFSATVLRHSNLAQRAVYQVESKSDVS
jgi:hypothetical protein